jgi:hypothetical protein
VRLFSVFGGTAGELRYPAGYPWGPATNGLPRYRLVRIGKREAIATPGRPITIVKRAQGGTLDVAVKHGARVTFTGWSADSARARLSDELLVFAGPNLVYLAHDGLRRPDVARYFHEPRLARSGFAFQLPSSVLTSGKANLRVRLFSVFGQRAVELHYPARYPWGGSTNPLPGYRLVRIGGREAIATGRKPFTIAKHVDGGSLDKTFGRGGSVTFIGWSADPLRARVSDELLVFAGSKLVYVAHDNARRADVGRYFHKPQLSRSGFQFTLRRVLLTARGTHVPVRLFSIFGRKAVELHYPPRYPWRR